MWEILEFIVSAIVLSLFGLGAVGSVYWLIRNLFDG